MSIVSLASAKGSPGVTTTALALASWWPRPLVVLEADPAGGDLAARLGLPEEPGLVGLAASLRRDPRGSRQVEGWLEPYVQQTPAGINFVTAPAGSGQAAAAVGLLSGRVTFPHPEEADLIVDMGRLVGTGHTGSPLPQPSLRDAADAFVWVCRPQLADLAHLDAEVEPRVEDRFQSMVVLVGDGPYPANEVATALGVTVLGHLPADPSGVAALWAGDGRTWAHSALGRAAKDLATALAGLLDTESIARTNRDEPLGSPGEVPANVDLDDVRAEATTAGGFR